MEHVSVRRLSAARAKKTSSTNFVVCKLAIAAQFFFFFFLFSVHVDGATTYATLFNAIQNKQSSLAITGTIVLEGNLPNITHSMTITGSSKAKIDAVEWRYRLLVVHGASAKLVLKNVEMYKGQAPLKSSRPAKRFPPLADGGAVLLYDGASAEFHNVFFNHSKAWNGAAIAAYGRSSVKVYSSRFLNNYAWYAGGAIYLTERSTACVDSSSFERNKGPGEGGAVVVKGGSYLQSTKSTYKRNTCKDEGGAGWLVEEANSVAVSIRDTFYENKGGVSSDRGGAVLVKEGGKLFVSKSTFVRNTVPSGIGNTIYVDGGIIGLLDGPSTSIVEWNGAAGPIPTNPNTPLPRKC